MRLNPNNCITIEILPYTPKFVARHKHGCTHLVRVIESKPELRPDGSGGASHDGSTQPYVAGKILNIFEQQVTIHDQNDLARTLRRYGDWQRPPRKSRAKKRTGLGGRIDEAKDKIAARPRFLRSDDVGGGHGSGSDYREA